MSIAIRYIHLYIKTKGLNLGAHSTNLLWYAKTWFAVDGSSKRKVIRSKQSQSTAPQYKPLIQTNFTKLKYPFCQKPNCLNFCETVSTTKCVGIYLAASLVPQPIGLKMLKITQENWNPLKSFHAEQSSAWLN